MKTIVVMAGSNSEKSINKKLAIYAASQVANVNIVEADLNKYSLPIYGIDTENENGFPENVLKLNELLNTADGFVISLAEHNGSYAAAFKNTFDWLSRFNREVWKNKPMFLMSTSPGGRGAKTVLEMAKTSFPRLGGNIIADFSLPFFNDNFSENGLADKDLNTELNEKINMLEKAILA